MRRRTKLICGAVIVICLLGFELVARFRGDRDFAAIARGEPPVFAVSPLYPADGGSVEYRGFGYTVWQLHQKAPGPNGSAYRVGPRLLYWLPLPLIAPNRDSTIIADR